MITLVMALIVMCGWARSFTRIDRFIFPDDGYRSNRIVSFGGNVVWQHVVPVDESKWSTEIHEEAPLIFHEFAEGAAEYLVGQFLSNEDNVEWKQYFFGFAIGQHRQEGSLRAVLVTIWKLSYWLIITPLTLISAWLLLSKPRHRTKVKT